MMGYGIMAAAMIVGVTAAVIVGGWRLETARRELDDVRRARRDLV